MADKKNGKPKVDPIRKKAIMKAIANINGAKVKFDKNNTAVYTINGKPPSRSQRRTSISNAVARNMRSMQTDAVVDAINR